MPVTYAQDPQFADFLLSNTQSEAFNRYLEKQNIPFQDINPLYKQIWFPLDRLSDNLLNDTIYTSIPKLYIPQSLTALENTGILPVQQRVSLALTGKNILIGFLDSGISYTQPAFLDTAGRTRIEAIWDQTEIVDPDNSSPFSYGRLYTSADIQNALQNTDPYAIVPSRDETGHGTAIAGITAGSEDTDAGFTGAAPQARLAMVKLQRAKPYLLTQACLKQEQEIYAETDILCGISWLMTLSRELKLPLVVCFGIQSWQGSHNGGTALERTVDYLSDSPGICFVTGTGNEADQQHHQMIRSLTDGSYGLTELLVEKDTPSFSMEFWAPPVFSFVLSITSPSGDQITGLMPRLGSLRLTFPLDETIIEFNFETFRSESGNQLVYFRFLTPSPGVWTIRTDLTANIDADLHLWLPPASTIGGGVRFLRPDPFTTAMSPANAPENIAAAAAQTANTSTLSSSGRGLSFSGMQVPTLAAVGESLLAPSYISGYQSFTGSSAACALCAGAAALVMEWGRKNDDGRYLSTTDIRTFLLRGCSRPPGASYPNPQSGYGYLDLEASFLNNF